MTEFNQQDLQLVEKLLKGDEASFTLFYNTYFPRVFRFCRLRVSDEQTCNDVVQQTLINAMKGLSHYRGEASLLTWLNQICRNEISAWYKKTGAKMTQTSSLDQNPNLQAVIESIPSGIGGERMDLLDDGIKELVQVSLDSLPSAYGKALELKYIEGLSVAEIAQHFDMGDVAIQSLLARARKAFKSVFSDLQKDYLALGHG